MAAVTGVLPIAASIDEARAQLRIEAGHDDALLAGLLRSATALCEQVTGLALVERAVTETLAISGEWQRLAMTPVRAISAVEGVPAEGSAFAFPVASYAIDIDPRGDGWVKVSVPGAAGRMRVRYAAGLAASAGEVPEGLRQGIMLLTAHLHRERDRSEGKDPPASVAALWRPWRRMRLS